MSVFAQIWPVSFPGGKIGAKQFEQILLESLPTRAYGKGCVRSELRGDKQHSLADLGHVGDTFAHVGAQVNKESGKHLRQIARAWEPFQEAIPRY